ncbi:RxLR-like protein [Plasmopara halstedii]|uniref:RxLR-like protein n=1 Tax=Plasmopara halstedii TaxID=4781 RepID=A0A0P1B698_PLAHL|nr:RxLR-like protein [Plasmopara halstedii]CEG49071.1 RxLR-like protein [Plasmopara halstedii]|eukprot:XP_024585440.1 RxLR-like protein [Plasmopara halstedii]
MVRISHVIIAIGLLATSHTFMANVGANELEISAKSSEPTQLKSVFKSKEKHKSDPEQSLSKIEISSSDPSSEERYKFVDNYFYKRAAHYIDKNGWAQQNFESYVRNTRFPHIRAYRRVLSKAAAEILEKRKGLPPQSSGS